MKTIPLVVLGALALGSFGCGDDSVAVPPPKHHVAGDAIPFDNGPDGRIAGAKISVLEHPEMTMTTGEDGHFQFDGFEPGSEVTLVLEHPDYHLIQTGTQIIGDADVDRLTFQAVTYQIYDALAGVVEITPDEKNACQMVTTITRIGKSIYDTGAHGEYGVKVTLDPPLPAEHGPIYFNALVIPDKSLKESSADGGAMYIQVPPGEYTWTGTKEGTELTSLKMKCRPGVLVNASPPHGIQRTK